MPRFVVVPPMCAQRGCHEPVFGEPRRWCEQHTWEFAFVLSMADEMRFSPGVTKAEVVTGPDQLDPMER